MEIEKGKSVIVVGVGNNARYSIPIHEATIHSIGRKWFKVNCKSSSSIEDRERFDICTGYCDGRGYMSEWRVFLSRDEYHEFTNFNPKRLELESKLRKLSYKQLIEIEQLIKTFDQ